MELGICNKIAAEQFLYRNTNRDAIFGMYEWHLVHGLVTGTMGPAKGTQFTHAWLECPHLGVVWDVEDKIVPIELYYRVGNVQNEIHYDSKADVIGLALLHGDWGPWDEILRNHDIPKDVMEKFLSATREEIEKDGPI
jgi:hypothetical protein